MDAPHKKREARGCTCLLSGSLSARQLQRVPSQRSARWLTPRAPALGARRLADPARIQAAAARDWPRLDSPSAMKLPLPADFFAPVQLSAQETHQLKLVELQLLEGYLRSYDEFAAATRQDAADRYQLRHRRRGDLVETSSAKWAFVRQQGALKVFRKHHTHHRQQYHFRHYQPTHAHGATGKASPCPDPRHRHADHAHLAGVLVEGSIDGTVEDLMYGTMWNSTRERATRTFFTRDGVLDAAVLHSVEQPTPIDPWRSLAIKWSMKRAPPLSATLLVKDRDFCYLAASGIVRTSDGTRVGYRLRHSVTFPSCPPFQNRSVVRGQIYFCSLFRQLKHGRVEVFHQGSYDAGGGVLRSIAEKAVVATLANYVQIPQFALTRKLAHALHLGERERRTRVLSIESNQGSLEDAQRCGVCLDKLPGFPDTSRRCAICRHEVCANCSVRREVEAPSHQPHGLSKSTRAVARCFCKHCVAKVLRDDATMYGVREASQKHRASRTSHIEEQQQQQQYQSNRRRHRPVSYHNSGRSNVRWAHDEIDDEFPSAESTRQHSITLYAPDECTYEVEEHRVLSRRRNTIAGIAVAPPVASRQESVPQLGSVASSTPSTIDPKEEPEEVSTPSTAVGNAVGMAWSSRGRSATAPHVFRTAPTSFRVDDSDDSSVRRVLPRTQSLYATNAPPILLRSDVGKRNWRLSTSALSLDSSHSSSSDAGAGAASNVLMVPVPTRAGRHRRRHRHRHHGSNSSRSSRCSSLSSNSSSSSTVLVSLSSRGPPVKRVDFPSLPRPTTRRTASHT